MLFKNVELFCDYAGKISKKCKIHVLKKASLAWLANLFILYIDWMCDVSYFYIINEYTNKQHSSVIVVTLLIRTYLLSTTHQHSK